MEEYTINLFKGKEFYKTYKTKLVPVVGDMISISDTEVFSVEKRMMPSADVKTVLLFGSIM